MSNCSSPITDDLNLHMSVAVDRSFLREDLFRRTLLYSSDNRTLQVVHSPNQPDASPTASIHSLNHDGETVLLSEQLDRIDIPSRLSQRWKNRHIAFDS